jgi:hypothetical protein
LPFVARPFVPRGISYAHAPAGVCFAFAGRADNGPRNRDAFSDGFFASTVSIPAWPGTAAIAIGIGAAGLLALSVSARAKR